MIEYFSENLWQLWALVAVICLVLELSSGDFFIMCFAIGGACACIGSAFGCGFYAGLAIFAVTSVLSLFFVRPAVLRFLHRKEDSRVSNADALMGREGRVTESIEAAGFGRVQIDGDFWKAQSVNGAHIQRGKRVKVVGRDSIIITVEPIQEEVKREE